MMSSMSEWRAVAQESYDPLMAGSIDCTDTEPHDRGVVRALGAHHRPPDLASQPCCTLFVGRLPRTATEDQLHQKFSQFGQLASIQLVRDLVTGESKRYAFVEFARERDAQATLRQCGRLEVEGCPVLVDREVGRTLGGWVPRRLGGGWGGRKEAGQLRFGCRDRPWKKPIVVQPKHHTTSSPDTLSYKIPRDARKHSDDRPSKMEARWEEGGQGKSEGVRRLDEGKHREEDRHRNSDKRHKYDRERQEGRHKQREDRHKYTDHRRERSTEKRRERTPDRKTVDRSSEMKQRDGRDYKKHHRNY